MQTLDAGHQSAVNWVKQQQTNGADIRVNDIVESEIQNYVSPFAKVPITVDRSSTEYQKVVQELEQNNVGNAPPKGVNDRNIVADVFFAETEPGVIPTLATQDKGIYNSLARLAGIDPNQVGGSGGIPGAYPNGYPVTVEGKTIRVVVPPK